MNTRDAEGTYGSLAQLVVSIVLFAYFLMKVHKPVEHKGRRFNPDRNRSI